MYSSSTSFGSRRNRSSPSRSAAVPVCRKVPLIGFIIDQAVVDADVPLRARADQDPGAGVHQERPVRAPLVAQQPAQRGQRGTQRGALHRGVQGAVDDEVGSLTPADLLGQHPFDDPRVLLVVDVEGGVAGDHRRRRQGGEQVGQRQLGVPGDGQVLQRDAVVHALEAPFGDLPVRHQRQRPGAGAALGQRQVGEPVGDVYRAGEQVDVVDALAAEQDERAGVPAVGDGGEQVVRVVHRVLLVGRAASSGGPGAGETAAASSGRPRESYARGMAAGSAGHQQVRCAGITTP